MNTTMRPTLTDCQAYDRRPAVGSVAAWVARLLGRWRNRIKERQALAMMDARDLRDVGLSRWEIERELAKPFWWG